MDEADLASISEDQHRMSSLNAQSKHKPQLHPIGVCHYCDAVVGEKQLFCDVDCSTDWEHMEKQKRQLGR